MKTSNIIRVFACYGLATLTGYTASRFNLPLPWMIGPLICMAIINMFIATVEIPVKTRPIGQIIIAAQVGLYFSSDALRSIFDHVGIIIGMAISTVLLSFILSLFLKRISNCDPVTAFLSCLPGGPVEMANLAQKYGGNTGVVVFAQTLRITTIVTCIPLALYYINGAGSRASALVGFEYEYLGMFCLTVGAVLTSTLFYFLRINSPFFLGALAFASMASATDVLPLSPYPSEVLAFGQILLGTWLGSTFKRALFQRAGRQIGSVISTTGLLIISSALLAIIIAELSDISWRTLVLGSAPGSVTEMALTAKFLHDDVALITAFHLMRIFLILPNVPWMVKLIKKQDN